MINLLKGTYGTIIAVVIAVLLTNNYGWMGFIGSLIFIIVCGVILRYLEK
jgi:hypothetical protein